MRTILHSRGNGCRNHMVNRNTRKMLVAIAIGAASALMMRGSAIAATQCSPFGDPPARVDRGWFATSVSNHNPICFGGKVVGPWRDADGLNRYACLYEPKSAAKDNPLPLVIVLHGSLATADS